MAEFVETIQKFKEMCQWYGGRACCRTNCIWAGNNVGQCRKRIFSDPVEFELLVTAWLRNHPEPKYPTWSQWFMDTDVLMPSWDWEKVVYALNTTRIPADIAQRLGIPPEGDRK